MLPKCADYADIFSSDLAMELPKNTVINKHTMKLVEGKQPPYNIIYSLGSLELEILKAYIETHLKTWFIYPSKYPSGIPISFNKKSDRNLWLCVDYRGFNNLIIKNRYPLYLIGEFLNRLVHAKRFT